MRLIEGLVEADGAISSFLGIINSLFGGGCILDLLSRKSSQQVLRFFALLGCK